MLHDFLLYSKVNELYIYIYPRFFRFYSHTGHYRVLSRVPCAIYSKLCLTSEGTSSFPNDHAVLVISLSSPGGNRFRTLLEQGHQNRL